MTRITNRSRFTRIALTAVILALMFVGNAGNASAFDPVVLVVSDFQCIDSANAELHFILAVAPTSANYGQVDWTGTMDGAPVSGAAFFTGLVGLDAHYTQIVPLPSGVHTLAVQTASVTVNDKTRTLANPQSYNIECAALGVVFGDFTATAQGDSVRLAWETMSEWDNIGFIVYRGAAIEAMSQIGFLPSPVPGGTVGASYAYTDTQVPPATYWYAVGGRSAYGGIVSMSDPVSVTVQAPTAVTLSSLAAGNGLTCRLAGNGCECYIRNLRGTGLGWKTRPLLWCRLAGL
jgi:hypothetical protein